MLTEFSIGNYQAFSTPQRVPLKPITLIFGPNSAGKSSLLRSLLVAKHAILNGRLSKSEGAGERHPGSYADIVRNGSSNPITFEFSVQSAGEPIEIGLSWSEKNEAGLETVALTLKKKESEVVGYSTKWSSKHLQISSMGEAMSRLIVAARSEFDAEGNLDELLHRTINNRLALLATIALPGTNADHYGVEDSGNDKTDILSALEELHAQGKSTESGVAWMKKIQTSVDELKSEISTPIKEVAAVLKDTLKKLIYHGPIRPICDEVTKDRQTEPGMTEWWNLAAEPELLAKVNHWLAGDIFKTKYRLEFDRLFPESSLKNVFYETFMEVIAGAAFQAKLDSDHSYRESVIERLAVDYEDSAEDSLKNELQDGEEELSISDIQDRAYAIAQSELDAHYDELGLEYYEELDAEEAKAFLINGLEYFNENRMQSILESAGDGKGLQTPGGFDSARVKFSLAFGRNRTSPSNMGIGFSQMMPLVASAFGSANRLIAIEQPELHVHPALQTELADLFIQSAKEHENRFLIETHSEHLILRLLRRVRETTEGQLEAGRHPLRPEDLCILYVQPGDKGSEVIELPVTPDGDFSRPWPNGFFDERTAELF